MLWNLLLIIIHNPSMNLQNGSIRSPSRLPLKLLRTGYRLRLTKSLSKAVGRCVYLASFLASCRLPAEGDCVFRNKPDIFFEQN